MNANLLIQQLAAAAAADIHAYVRKPLFRQSQPAS